MKRSGAAPAGSVAVPPGEDAPKPIPASFPATTPEAPYYAVIFSSLQGADLKDYHQTAERMLELAAIQPGYLGVESVQEGVAGITVSYWRDLDAISDWKRNAEHQLAQQRGREDWYLRYRVRVCRVERVYGLD